MSKLKWVLGKIKPFHDENFIKGYKIQRWILDLLPDAKPVEFQRNDQGKAMHNLPYDIEWNNLAIDIKSSWNGGDDIQYLFTISNLTAPGTHLCDYYLCVGIYEGKPRKIWFVPAQDLNFHTNFTPAIDSSRSSKYDKYLVWVSKENKNNPYKNQSVLD